MIKPLTNMLMQNKMWNRVRMTFIDKWKTVAHNSA